MPLYNYNGLQADGKTIKPTAIRKARELFKEYALNGETRRTSAHLAMHDINKAICGHGVEFIEDNSQEALYCGSTSGIEYINTGDLHTTTIIYDTRLHTFSRSTVADYMERCRARWEQSETLEYTLCSYDLWGNARDGFTVNDVFIEDRGFTLTHHQIKTDRGIIAALKVDGYINPRDKYSSYEIDGEPEHTLYINKVTARSGGYMPVYELRNNKQ